MILLKKFKFDKKKQLPQGWGPTIIYECSSLFQAFRDRSFFMREVGLVGFGGGGPLEKIGLKVGASRKKMKERWGGGGADEKIRLKIG